MTHLKDYESVWRCTEVLLNRPEEEFCIHMHFFVFSDILSPTLYISTRSVYVGAFATLRKVTVSFVMSVVPSVRLELLGFQ